MPSRKSIAVGTTYQPPGQSDLSETINTHFSKLDFSKLKLHTWRFNLISTLTIPVFFKTIIFFKVNRFLVTS